MRRHCGGISRSRRERPRGRTARLTRPAPRSETLPGRAPCLGVVVLDDRRRGDRLGPPDGPAALELALLDVLVHALLFVGHLRQVASRFDNAQPYLDRPTRWSVRRESGHDLEHRCCRTGSSRIAPTSPRNESASQALRRDWWTRGDSNPWPRECDSRALPAELRAHSIRFAGRRAVYPRSYTRPPWPPSSKASAFLRESTPRESRPGRRSPRPTAGRCCTSGRCPRWTSQGGISACSEPLRIRWSSTTASCERCLQKRWSPTSTASPAGAGLATPGPESRFGRSSTGSNPNPRRST